MAKIDNARDVTTEMKKVRQIRQYKPDAVPEEIIQELLEVAQWTGSSRNTQPWHFIVVTDKSQLHDLSQIRTPINWVAAAPLAIAIVLDGTSQVSEAYDEGRVTERLMIAARLLGLGGGTAWFGDEAQQARGKEILGIPGRENRPLGRGARQPDHLQGPTPECGRRRPPSAHGNRERRDVRHAPAVSGRAQTDDGPTRRSGRRRRY